MNDKPQNDQKTVMELEDTFQFECRPGLECFTDCCGDVNIFLGPYDVIRLKTAIDTRSDVFLEKYTTILARPDGVLPLVVLKMNEDDKRCPFVTEEGCSVYEHRPWSCRLYPLDLNDDGTFSYLVGPERCHGLRTEDKTRIHQWLQEQDVVVYQDMHLLYSQIISHPRLGELDVANPQIRRMILMAVYDLDRFKDFVLQTSFLEKFDIPEQTIFNVMRYDVELMKLGFDWVKFGLFGEQTLKLKDDVAAAAQKEKPEETADERG